MDKINIQKKWKGNPTLEHTIMVDLLRRRGFLSKYFKYIFYKMHFLILHPLINAFLLVIILILLAFKWKITDQ